MSITPLEEIIQTKIDHYGLEALEEWEKDYYVLFWLVALVSNDGFDGYFFYGGADHAYDAIQALKRLQFDWIASLIEKGIEQFPDSRLPEKEKRQEIMLEFSKSEREVFSTITNSFYEVIDNVRGKLEEIEDVAVQKPLTINDEL